MPRLLVILTMQVLIFSKKGGGCLEFGVGFL